MKTSYLQRNRKDKKLFKQAGILLIIFGMGSLFFGFTSGIISSALAPMWRGQSKLLSSASGVLALTKSVALEKENQRLRSQLSNKEAELVSLRVSKEKEEELMGILGREPNKNAVLASVIMRPPQSPYDVLVIDAGSGDGIEVGQSVSMPEGPELGKIIEVSGNSSKVKLYSASGEKTNAILERYSVPVILIGQGGGSFALNLPKDVQVEEGDKILTAGTSSRLLAVVSGVDMVPTDSFKKVIVKGASNIFALRYVLVNP